MSREESRILIASVITMESAPLMSTGNLLVRPERALCPMSAEDEEELAQCRRILGDEVSGFRALQLEDFLNSHKIQETLDMMHRRDGFCSLSTMVS